MSTFVSYEQEGKKLSFANWISNLSPQEVPFVSMTGKESINQTLFQWQTDSLAPVGENAVIEGSAAASTPLGSTTKVSNVTQILRKVVQVSDTANVTANYGRGKELQYQMEKKGKEIKRDLEYALLHNEAQVEGNAGTARKTAGFRGLVAAVDAADPDTGAVVHKDVSAGTGLSEDSLFDLTYQLYIAGSSANIIMFHPKHAAFFSSLQERGDAGAGVRSRIFENTTRFAVQVTTIVDPLGQEYKLIPNRWMPEKEIFFFNSSDWTQMVLRAPSRTKLAKDGSYEKWMIEMECGLRHRNPYASGILKVEA
ncbi:major head protein [Vibrio phage Vp_R1]|uniref:Capsid and scaffold protein n=1 Tax=Vibrio phage Vp_R1 TaxID=2059867 RepID=A0A2H5BQ84_9CAUD|nr:major head protein [Vibrio phage Vp_R1]AUG88475.1 capsid and scaffold protein [Vibrio phage Vp_R1]WPH64810.1 capsid and scaffold protein [Vibrio phage vB_VpaP_SJSY21]